MDLVSRIRKALLVAGISLLSISAILLFCVLAKLLPADALALAGHSSLREICSIAVAGCLLGALGSQND